MCGFAAGQHTHALLAAGEQNKHQELGPRLPSRSFIQSPDRDMEKSRAAGPLCDHPRDGHPLRCIYVVQCLLKSEKVERTEKQNNTRYNIMQGSALLSKPPAPLGLC
jgi:hypothetical protein